MSNTPVNLDSLLDTALQHHQSGHLPQAEALYRQILHHNPRHADALHLLGALAAQAQQPEMALALLRQSLAVQPASAVVWSNFGKVLKDLGRFDEAVDACRQALVIDPIFPPAYQNLGPAMAALAKLDEAQDAFRTAIGLHPTDAQTHMNLGTVLADCGQLDAGIAEMRQALALAPNYRVAHSALLLTQHYNPAIDPAALAQEHRLWNHNYAQPLRHLIRPHTNDRNPHRRLRIGYVSPNFEHHAVAPMVLPLIASHDPAQVEIFLYAQLARPDAITQSFQNHAPNWRPTAHLTDDQMADLVRRDAIDILVDLAGHTNGNRLLVFAQKPAPVQVTRQGYPNTTGLDTIDYRMTDTLADPPGPEGGSDALHTEKLIRLPRTNWIYQPPDYALNLPQSPFTENSPIVFGCFNNLSKVTEPTLRLWAQILAAVPNSRLLLKSRALATPSVQERLRALFASQGISPNRVQLAHWSATPTQHLLAYHQLAIALDPFPYNGTTTTCEALWMGVPVFTLAGQTHVARVGVSLLTNLGTPELIAHSPDEYLRIAVQLAHDRPRLANLHTTLRQKLQSSPIMHHATFARNIESAYRDMWHTWCHTPA